MDENKNINEQPENTVEIKVKSEKPKKLRNTALIKKGGYSVGITAAVLAGLILLNVLVGTLSGKVKLEFDISGSKNNTVSAENQKFIKSIGSAATITVCANEKDYTGSNMQAAAQQYYNVSDSNAAEYFKQTVNIVNKYAALNKDITVRYIDTQDSKFTEISTKYADEKINYGDILVTSENNSTERHKIVAFSDIYELSDENGYAAYGYGAYTIGSNNIETALSGALSYVTSSKTKKAAVLTGHSGDDYTTELVKTLKNNSYEVETVEDNMITSVPSEFDAVIIAAPVKDFLESELNAISEFLDNDGKYGKGLIYFADAANPYLPTLNGFLSEWGIKIDEGILFQTNSKYHTENSPMEMGIYPSGDNDITKNMNYCIASYNVPMKTAEAADGITATELFTTADGVVNAPVGTAADWSDYGDYESGTYAGIIQSAKGDDENKSYVFAFGSVEYIMSEWISYSSLDNMNIALSSVERAVGSEDSGMTFVAKTVKNESYSESVTAAKTALIRLIFMFILPVAAIVTGIYIYVKRRNA